MGGVKVELFMVFSGAHDSADVGEEEEGARVGTCAEPHRRGDTQAKPPHAVPKLVL